MLLFKLVTPPCLKPILREICFDNVTTQSFHVGNDKAKG